MHKPPREAVLIGQGTVILKYKKQKALVRCRGAYFYINASGLKLFPGRPVSFIAVAETAEAGRRLVIRRSKIIDHSKYEKIVDFIKSTLKENTDPHEG